VTGPTIRQTPAGLLFAADQINGANFNKLEVAWRFKTDRWGHDPSTSSRHAHRHQRHGTRRGTRRAVVALDGATGEPAWVTAREGATRAAVVARGLSYWTDGKEERDL
jgi:quinoprotein glucose dehydrogenase